MERVCADELVAFSLNLGPSGSQVAGFDHHHQHHEQRRQAEQEPAIAQALPRQQRQRTQGCQRQQDERVWSLGARVLRFWTAEPHGQLSQRHSGKYEDHGKDGQSPEQIECGRLADQVRHGKRQGVAGGRDRQSGASYASHQASDQAGVDNGRQRGHPKARLGSQGRDQQKGRACFAGAQAHRQKRAGQQASAQRSIGWIRARPCIGRQQQDRQRARGQRPSVRVGTSGWTEPPPRRVRRAGLGLG